MQTPNDSIIDYSTARDAPPSLVCDTAPGWASLVGSGARLGIASIFDQGVVSATNFATTLILARLCEKSDVGVYYLAWTLLLFIVAAQANLVSVPYTVYFRRREGLSLASYSGSMLVHQALTSVMVVAGLLGLGLFLSFGYGPQAMRSLGWVLACAAPFILLREYARRLLFAHLRLFIAIVMDVASCCAQLVSLLILGYFNMLTIPAVYAVMGVASVLALLIWLFTNREPIRFQSNRFLPDWRDNWNFGKWALAGQLAGLAFYVLPWLLTFAHGEAETGMFAAGNTLVGLANLSVTGLCNFLTPRSAQAFAREGAAGLWRVLGKASIVFMVLLGLFCLIAALFGDYLALIVFGPKYHGAGPLIAVLSLATLVDALGLTANTGLWAIDRPAANFPADIAQLIVTLATALWLVFPLGPLGIAIAMVLGRSTGAALRWITLRGLLETSFCQADAA
jgi:O-antigen/teichoic acid export membrane protein